jgi:hypothetical protein
MCLLMTLAAAIAASLAWYCKGRNGATKLDTLALMYWGAALMWMVDGFFSLAEGEPFLELTRDDALLGLLVTAAGLIVHFLLRFHPWRTCKTGS